MLIVGKSIPKLTEFHMKNAKIVSTPLATHFKLSSRHSPSNKAEKTNVSRVPYPSIMGSLMYAMVCIGPDIAHVVGTNVVKWILRYLHDTSDLRLCFGGDKPTFMGCSDSNMAGDIDSRKSISSYLIKFAGGVKCVALSTTKAKFIVITEACKELLWDKYLLFCDSQSAIHLGKNSTFHSRSKHINVRYHWIRDALDAKLLELAKVHTDDNGTNMMTKALLRGKFEACCEIVG
ncbi:hypothetical protein CR513_61391, partial [Mucuna pruriens]